MDKPTPDGKLVIEFMDGHEATWLLEEIRFHAPTRSFYVVHLERPEKGRVEYPIQHIRRLHLIYNSEEYLANLRKWSDETHYLHLDSERDINCLRCGEDARNELLGIARGVDDF